MPMYVSVVALVRVFLTLLSLVLAAVAVLTWQRRRTAPEARIFTLLVLSAAIYCFGYAGEVASASLGRAMFWLHVEYFGIPWIPALWLLGMQPQKRLNRGTPLLFVIPGLTFLGQLSNAYHGLYDRSVGFMARGPFGVVTVERGPIAWLNLAYLNFALFYGAWIYLRSPRTPGHSRSQRLIVVGASLVPLGGYLIYLFGWSPWGLDLAPLLLSVSVVLGYIAVFRLGVFDLVPMARSLVFADMRDGVIITDMRQRLVDFNRAAQQILPPLGKARPGEALGRVLHEFPDAVRALTGHEEAERLELDHSGQRLHFDVRISPLYHHNERVGFAATLANITPQIELLHELQHNAETDDLTGVANRRSFLTNMEREAARAVRYQQSFSVALIDVDRFKCVNDSLGHSAGDNVLFVVADRILGCIRASDMLCRYGGDEFAILLPQTGLHGAYELAERVRRTVAEARVEVGAEEPVCVSLSIGLATLLPEQPPDWGLLLKHADKALYEAKARGRNGVVAWEELKQSLAE